MFSDNTNDNTNTNQEQVNEDLNTGPHVAELSLGSNPSVSFSSPTLSQAPSDVTAVSDNASSDDSQPTEMNSHDNTSSTTGVDLSKSTDGLEQIKVKAVGELAPLVGKLDQSPEDKFKTLMMLIQASDNQELLKDAFEATHEITDDNVKAQALLSIINEINYFTQQK